VRFGKPRRTSFPFTLVSHNVTFGHSIPIEEIDDEYWMPPAADNGGVAPPMPKQPDGVPSKISFFVAYLKLGQILAFALRTIYTINKSKVLLGFVGEQWEQHIVAELGAVGARG